MYQYSNFFSLIVNNGSTSGARTLSSQASNYDEDVQFANLLKPIKDLTVNWSVPLSNFLTQYHEELYTLIIKMKFGRLMQ